jgi:hypothetical protein
VRILSSDGRISRKKSMQLMMSAKTWEIGRIVRIPSSSSKTNIKQLRKLSDSL